MVDPSVQGKSAGSIRPVNMVHEWGVQFGGMEAISNSDHRFLARMATWVEAGEAPAWSKLVRHALQRLVVES